MHLKKKKTYSICCFIVLLQQNILYGEIFSGKQSETKKENCLMGGSRMIVGRWNTRRMGLRNERIKKKCKEKVFQLIFFVFFLFLSLSVFCRSFTFAFFTCSFLRLFYLFPFTSVVVFTFQFFFIYFFFLLFCCVWHKASKAQRQICLKQQQNIEQHNKQNEMKKNK